MCEYSREIIEQIIFDMLSLSMENNCEESEIWAEIKSASDADLLAYLEIE